MTAGPLKGRTIVLTRPAHQIAATVRALEAADAAVLRFPVLAIDALDVKAVNLTLPRDADVRLIFTSTNAVEMGVPHLKQACTDVTTLTSYAIGDATAAALQSMGFGDVRKPITTEDSEGLLARDDLHAVDGLRFLLVKGSGGRTLIADTLRQRGATVEELVCYRRRVLQPDAATLLARWRANEVSAISCLSGETLEAFARAIGPAGRPLLANTVLVVPNRRLATVAENCAPGKVLVSGVGDASLVDALVRHFSHE